MTQNPYWKPGSAADGYSQTVPWTPTAKDGYTYSQEYWETLHQMDVLFQKNQGWIPGGSYSAEALAELDQYNQMNQDMRDKEAAGVQANDPALYALQQANAAYHANPTPDNLTAYNNAYAAWWEDHMAWMSLPQNQKPVPPPPPAPPKAVAPWHRFGLLPWMNPKY